MRKEHGKILFGVGAFTLGAVVCSGSLYIDSGVAPEDSLANASRQLGLDMAAELNAHNDTSVAPQAQPMITEMQPVNQLTQQTSGFQEGDVVTFQGPNGFQQATVKYINGACTFDWMGGNEPCQ